MHTRLTLNVTRCNPIPVIPALLLQGLGRTWKWKRLTVASDVVGAILGQACQITPGPHGTLTITMGPGELDEADEEAVDVLRWMRMAHASLRSTRRLRRCGARWQDVVDMRWRLTPYRAKPVLVDAEGGDRVGAVCDLQAIVDVMVECARLEGDIRGEEEFRRDGGVLVIIVFDATPFHKASATRCDVFVDVWSDVGAPAQPRCWATWWVFDGADDAEHLSRMDAVAGLTRQVQALEGGQGFEVKDGDAVVRRYPYLCAVSGDGKAMGAGNHKRGCVCWVCDRSTAEINSAFQPEDLDAGARFGAVAACVPVSRRIGDVDHCASRVVTALVKRLQAAAALHSQTANRNFRAYVADLKQEAKKIPVADRVRNTPVKEHTIDITTARLFLRDAELQSLLVATVETPTMGQLRWRGTGRWIPVHRVVRLLVGALVYLHAVWRQRERASVEVCHQYEEHVYQLAGAWETFRWTVPTWVHWTIVHSTAVLKRWGNFVKFSSIPSEFRNRGFKMDVRHCFQGWKLSKPHITAWGLKHSINLDALDWGLRRHFAARFGNGALEALEGGLVRKRAARGSTRGSRRQKRVRVR